MSRPWIWAALAAVAVALLLVRIQKTPIAEITPESKASLTNALISLVEHEAAMAQKHWGPELLAEKHGAVFERLWDAINSASNKFAVVKDFAAPKVIWAERGPAREAAHGVRILDPS